MLQSSNMYAFDMYKGNSNLIKIFKKVLKIIIQNTLTYFISNNKHFIFMIEKICK